MATGGYDGEDADARPSPPPPRWVPPASPDDWSPPASSEWTPPWSPHRAGRGGEDREEPEYDAPPSDPPSEHPYEPTPHEPTPYGATPYEPMRPGADAYEASTPEPDDAADGASEWFTQLDDRYAPMPPALPTGSAQRESVARARRIAETSRRRTGSVARATRARVRRATNAEGAGESGLAKLIELHAVNSAGDVFIAVSLAGTLFFSVPTGEARGNVAAYLFITMAPFLVVAPVIGPVLDRFRNGRRGAIAGSFALRAFLAWVLAGAVAGGGIELYPAAFGVLVASKAYVVTRSATLPRLLPPGVSLVKANAKVSLAGAVSVAIATPLAVGLAWIGPQWSLRFAFLIFVAGTILSAMLPAVVDSSEGEVDANVLVADQPSKRTRLGNVGAAVVLGLRVNAALRATAGFLTIFLLFLVRDQPVGGLSSELSVALVGVSAVAGSTLGSVGGSRVRARAPEPIIVSILAAAALVALVTALFYDAITVALIAGMAGFGQQLGKLSLDAQIQRDVPERVRSSAFARAETAIQLAWVLGGGLGIVLPLNATLGMSVVAGGLLVALVFTARSYLALRRVTAVRPGSGTAAPPDSQPATG